MWVSGRTKGRKKKGDEGALKCPRHYAFKRERGTILVNTLQLVWVGRLAACVILRQRATKREVAVCGSSQGEEGGPGSSATCCV